MLKNCQYLALNVKETRFGNMEKLFEKIGDHFNNPEMSDRILIVKIRKDGWEKLEAARRVRSITKTNSQDGNDDTISVTNNKQQEKPNKSEQNESIVSATEEKISDESSPSTADDSFNLPSISISDISRTVSSLSCDSGIGDTSSTEAKRTVKSKKREEYSVVVEKEESMVNSDTGKLQSSGDSDSNGSSDVDLDITFSKLLIADISYAHKAGAIGLTSVSPGEDGASASSMANGVIKTSEEDLSLADTVIREHQLCVHSFWLALNSSYFRSLFFSSGMKETKVKKV